jgi:hypothetical protein
LSEPFPEPERRRWTIRATAIGLAVVAGFVALHLVNRLTIDSQLLNINEEQNIQSWGSTFVFTVAGLIALVAGLESRVWLAVGVVMVAFSLDDVAMLHERLEEETDEGVALLEIEPLLALAVVAVFVLAARTVAKLPRLLLIGGVLALFVAQGTSSVGFLRDELGIPLGVLVVIEEGAELLAGILVAAAAVDPALCALNALCRRG